MDNEPHEEFDGRTAKEQIDFENESLLAYKEDPFKKIEFECRYLITTQLIEVYPRGCDIDEMKTYLKYHTHTLYHYYVCWAMLYGQPYDNIIRLILKNGEKITGISQ